MAWVGHRRWVVPLLAAFASALPLRGDSPPQAYRELFEAEEKQVLATSSKVDDAAFAGKLLAAAKQVSGDAAFQAFLWQKTVEVGSAAPEGFAAALEALNQLETAHPEESSRWRDKRLELYQARYRLAPGKDRPAAAEDLADLLVELAEARAASQQWSEATDLYRQALATDRVAGGGRRAELDEALGEIARRQRVEQNLGVLKARLENDAEDTAAREAMIRLYLAELGDPAGAAALLAPSVGEAFRTYVPLAAKDPNGLPEGACLELGGWYASLAEGAMLRSGKHAAYLRAQACYQRFLAQHQAEDPTRLKAKMGLQEVQKQLAALADAGPSARLSVSADTAFQTTKLHVRAGRFYEIVARGNWWEADGQTCGPEGIAPSAFRQWLGPQSSDAAKWYADQHSRGALIARIGQEKWTFLVANRCRFLAPASGPLAFAMNDVQGPAGRRAGRVSLSFRELGGFAWQAGKFLIEARIDDQDLLHITREGIYWEHPGAWSRVGQHSGYYPTVINSVYWWPQWPDGRRSALLESDAFYPAGGKRLRLAGVTAARGGCKLDTGRSDPGDIVLRFTDNSSGSSTVKALFVIE